VTIVALAPGFCFDSPSPAVRDDRLIPPGSIGQNTDGRVLQTQDNMV
jgi:hypothetical protein